jgi:CRISPR-associated endonuclease/helicase Cas3
MTGLRVEDFDRFVQDVHGRRPFPWQRRLVRRIVEDGWPSVIDVPTGLGKTSVIDAFVFAAALMPDSAPRRLFFVIDRRIVVDEAYDHAQAVAGALAEPDGVVVTAVADRLRLPQDDVPLDVTRMRGGVTWDWRWLDRPDRRAVVVGTVDQIGSRLLFRGYGVGERLRPIDAALVGCDSVIVVDEAHLSQPLVQTIARARALDGGEVGRPPAVVTMSATPGDAGEDVLRIGDDDRADPEAGKRLYAAKRLFRVEVAATPRKADAVVAAALADWARRVASDDSVRVVGVVANTVSRARGVFEMLRNGDRAAILLTGRIRPVDRDALLARHYDHIKAGRDRTAGSPLFVVATQTIEVGANVDFDGLVTESASLAALVQRLGRLNRLGAAPADAPCVVVHDGSVTEADPIYGAARLETWDWLGAMEPAVAHDPRGQTVGDLGQGTDVSPHNVSSLVGQLSPARRDAMTAAPPYVPVLFERTLDSWARTAPAPWPDTPVAPFLHGIDRAVPEVSLVWRAGLDPIDESPEVLRRWRDVLDAVPPVTEEMLDISIAAVRRWLTQPKADPYPVSDTGSAAQESDDAEPTDRRVLRYRGGDDVAAVAPDRLAPGDVVVLRSEDGGCDGFGWHPGGGAPVVDVADLALRRGRPVVRVRPYLLDDVVPAYGEDVGEVVAALLEAVEAHRQDESSDEPAGATARDAIRAALAPVPAEGSLLARVLHQLAAGPDATFATADTTYREVILARARSRRGEDSTALGSSLGGQVSLAGHQRAVGDRAGRFATNLGLDETLRRSVVTAAEWHDEGKRDLRFQAMLHGGDRLAAEVASEPLAKSGMSGQDRRAFRLARERARYPARMRHEALSARAAALYLAGRDDVDAELVRHLVASHHGWSRPLLPPVVDDRPEDVVFPGADGSVTLRTDECVDWDQPARFAGLNARYGRWGLALLETIVRLADIWCSEAGEGDG